MIVDYAAIPDELRQYRQWLCWQAEVRDGKPTKVPYRADGNGRAAVDSPPSWASFEEAVAALETYGFAGVGFVFTADDPYCGIDLDGCSDGTMLTSDAAAVLLHLDSYSEWSPSGRGVHVLLRARLHGEHRRKGGVEMYDRRRFFTVTGAHIVGTPLTIAERQAELDKFYAETFLAATTTVPATTIDAPCEPSDLDDQELLDRARNAKNGVDFDRLWRGDATGYRSQSEADLALCSMLAFWAGPDPARIDALFRGSGLMRSKWDDRRGETTYGAQTIAKALEGRTEFYSPPAAPTDSEQTAAPNNSDSEIPIPFPPLVTGTESGTPSVTPSKQGWNLPFAPLATKLENVPAEPLWLWVGFVCATVLTLVAGLPKVGKSTLLFGLLRALRDGEPFLGMPTRRGRALLLTEEREMTLAQKRTLFGLDGGDDVHVLMRYEVGDASWPEIVAQATAYALSHKLDVLIVDTLDKWMPLVGEGAENDTGTTVRNLLPLMEAASAGLAVILVTHHRKGDGRHGERVRGTTALTGAADVIVELERARGAFGDEGGRILSGTSRFQSTPETIAVELGEGEFVTVGSAEDGEARAEQATVMVALRAANAPQTRDEIKDELVAKNGEALRTETLAQRLAQMVARGDVVRSGAGKKGDPYRWTPAPKAILPEPGNSGNGIDNDEIERLAERAREWTDGDDCEKRTS